MNADRLKLEVDQFRCVVEMLMADQLGKKGKLADINEDLLWQRAADLQRNLEAFGDEDLLQKLAADLQQLRGEVPQSSHRRRVKPAPQLEHPSPPVRWAFLLACMARPGRADEVLGDAEEEYRRLVVRFRGADHLARWWYRVYVVKTAIQMLPNAAMRVLRLHKLLGPVGF